MTNAQLYLALCIPVVAMFLSMTLSLVQVSGIKDSIRDLRDHMDKRFDAQTAVMNARFDTAHANLIRVEQVMDARLKHLEKV